MYRIFESLSCTPETNKALYVNYTGFTFFKKEAEKHSLDQEI